MLLNRVLKTNSFRECAPKIALSLSPEALFSPKCTKYRLAVGQSVTDGVNLSVSKSKLVYSSSSFIFVNNTHTPV